MTRILIRTCGDASVGFGHAMRCETLARALLPLGCSVHFALRGDAAWLQRLKGLDGLTPLLLPNIAPEREAEWFKEALGQLDWVVVDDFALAAAYERAARRFAGRVAAIDGILREHDCDLWIDPVSRPATERETRNGRAFRVCQGPAYLLIAPEFVRLRAARTRSAAVNRLLITFGGGAQSAPVPVLDALQALAFKGQVVLAGWSPGPCGGARTLTLEAHTWCNDMASLAATCDAAIGAGGHSAWERCCLGLPSLVFALASNQRYVCDALSQAGAARVAPCAPERMRAVELRALIDDFLTQSEARAEMTRRAVALCDGLGASRVASTMLSLAREEPGCPS